MQTQVKEKRNLKVVRKTDVERLTRVETNVEHLDKTLVDHTAQDRASFEKIAEEFKVQNTKIENLGTKLHEKFDTLDKKFDRIINKLLGAGAIAAIIMSIVGPVLVKIIAKYLGA